MNMASRMGSKSKPFSIHVDRATGDRLDSRYYHKEPQKVDVKGVKGKVDTYFVYRKAFRREINYERVKDMNEKFLSDLVVLQQRSLKHNDTSRKCIEIANLDTSDHTEWTQERYKMYRKKYNVNGMNLIFTATEKQQELDDKNIETIFREKTLSRYKRNSLTAIALWVVYTFGLVIVMVQITANWTRDTELVRHGLILACVIGFRAIDFLLPPCYVVYAQPLISFVVLVCTDYTLIYWTGKDRDWIVLAQNILVLCCSLPLLHVLFCFGLLISFVSYLVYVILIYERGRNSNDIFLQATILLLVFLMINYKNYCLERSRRLDFIVTMMRHDKTKECHDLLCNMLPGYYVQKMLGEWEDRTNFEKEVTLLFSDLQGFTALTMALNNGKKLVMMLNDLYSAFDTNLEDFPIYKIDTEGDAVILVCGLNGLDRERIVHDALDMLDFANDMLFEMQKWNQKWEFPEEVGSVALRIGVHSGSVVSGTIGRKTPKFWLWGEDCHIAKKMESSGKPGRVHVSMTTYELAMTDEQCPHSFEKREGKVELKPFGLMMETYWLREQVTVRILDVQLQEQLKMLKINETEVIELKQMNQSLQTQLRRQNLTICDQQKMIYHLVNKVNGFEREINSQLRHWQCNWSRQANEEGSAQPFHLNKKKTETLDESSAHEEFPITKPNFNRSSSEPEVHLSSAHDLNGRLQPQKFPPIPRVKSPNFLELPSTKRLNDFKVILDSVPSVCSSNECHMLPEVGFQDHIDTVAIDQQRTELYQTVDEKKMILDPEKFTMHNSSRNSFNTPSASDAEDIEPEPHSPSLKEQMIELSSYQSSPSERLDTIKVPSKAVSGPRRLKSTPMMKHNAHLAVPSYLSTSGNSSPRETDQNIHSKVNLQRRESVLSYCTSLGPERGGCSIIDLLSWNDTKQADTKSVAPRCPTLTEKEIWLSNRLYGRSIMDRLRTLPSAKKAIVEQILRNVVDEHEKFNPERGVLSIKDDAQWRKILAEVAGELEKRGGLSSESVDILLRSFTGMDTKNCSSEFSTFSHSYGSEYYSDEKIEVKVGEYKCHWDTWQINDQVKTVYGRLMSFIYFLGQGNVTMQNKPNNFRTKTETIFEKIRSSNSEVKVQSRLSKERDSPLLKGSCASTVQPKHKRVIDNFVEMKKAKKFERIDESKRQIDHTHSLDQSDHSRNVMEQADLRTSENDKHSSPSVIACSFIAFESPKCNASPVKPRSTDKVKSDIISHDVQNLD